jgi:hypothetical protein
MNTGETFELDMKSTLLHIHRKVRECPATIKEGLKLKEEMYL